MHRKEAHVETDQDHEERELAESLVHHPAGELRKPVRDAAEHRKHVDAEQHVVQVRDDEVSLGQLPVERHRGRHHAGHAADHEHQHEAREIEERRLEHRAARPDRREPCEHRNRARHRDQHARRAEERERERRDAGGEHVMDPHLEADQHRRDRRYRDGRVRDERAPAERRHRVGHDAHRGQHDHVDPRVREHPEQVLPQQRAAARRDVEEMRADVAIEPEQQEREAHGGHREQVRERRGERAPDDDRQLVDRHAGRAHAQQRDDEVRRAHRRRDAEQDHAERVDVDVRAAAVVERRERHVVEPAAVRRFAQRKARVEERSRRDEHPVRERVQARKRHVARAEHQRPQIVREAGQHGQRVQEDHRHAVHREQLVVLLGVQQRAVGLRELDAHHERLGAAREQERERGDDVAQPDALVVDRREPAPPAGAAFPQRREPPLGGRARARFADLRRAAVGEAGAAIGVGGAHRRSPSFIAALPDMRTGRAAARGRAGSTASATVASPAAHRRSSGAVRPACSRARPPRAGGARRHA
ncbi:Uncharacterised protein [Burkholderia pseudomallei]|nr:Uncharacterised protein [Burkholderia pseudomallei]VBP52785.1 Uncharacterised protein [Burkholderia pseudomallei]VBQ03526.1 Uncharacterised protein [Burkholderia pseudomallei]